MFKFHFIFFGMWLGLSCQDPQPPKVAPTSPPLPVNDVGIEKEKQPKVPDRIFGLPVPPNAFSHFKIGRDEAVLVKAKLTDMERFYKKNLVDYEVLAQDKKVFIVGLRSFMSSANIYFYTNRHHSPLIIVFSGPDRELEKEKLKTPPPKKGEPVTLKTKDGKLLAPGAKWYEPYTPPVGSPLYKARYKSNWGTPFGKWKSN